MNITTVGNDLAKNVFQIHAADERGKMIQKKQIKRDQMVPFFSNLEPCLIGMEACCAATGQTGALFVAARQKQHLALDDRLQWAYTDVIRGDRRMNQMTQHETLILGMGRCYTTTAS